MIDLLKIKLVVWDLDDTFWTGTISEGDIIPSKENIKLVRELTNCGIVNSICSKNEFEVSKAELIKEGIWEYFVFSSINWDNKAMRLKSMIDNMALRPANVLFLDDNIFNLNEAKHFMPELNVALPDEILSLKDQLETIERKDPEHKRLNQYKILENKVSASLKYDSNEEFLYSTNILVEICENCHAEIRRIHELLMRSNQLNFTKKRISIEELELIINSPNYRCGYVHVKDNFGDYGIVGFYALRGDVLEHFFFSCRTMGQMIEQYVYAQLGYPKLTVVGEVRTQLNKTDCPKWINQNNCQYQEFQTAVKTIKSTSMLRVLVKGPCDLSKGCMFLQQSGGIDMELTHMRDNGQDIYYHNHSAFISQLYKLTSEQQKKLLTKWKFLEPESYSRNIFEKKYDAIFLSTLLESRVGIYKRKSDGLIVTYGHYDVPLTDRNNWEFYTTVSDDGYVFSKEELASFAEEFEYVGRTTVSSYMDFLDNLLEILPSETILGLTLGATKYWPEDDPICQHHIMLNEAIIKYATTHPRVQIISIDDCLESEKGYAPDKHIDHFNAKVYYNMASKMVEILQLSYGNNEDYVLKSPKFVIIDNFLNIINRQIHISGPLYRFLRNAYFYITGRQH